MSMMFHPMHVHGHTFAVNANGVRKDTVIVRPMQTIVADLDANNRSMAPATTVTAGCFADPLVLHVVVARRQEYLWGVCRWIR